MDGKKTWTSLRRMALFAVIRLVSRLHEREGTWRGQGAEAQADRFLVSLEQSPKAWRWPLRAEATLEDGTELAADLTLGPSQAPLGVRALLARHYALHVVRLGIPIEDALESARITELLEGKPFPRRGETRYKDLERIADAAAYNERLDREARELT